MIIPRARLGRGGGLRDDLLQVGIRRLAALLGGALEIDGHAMFHPRLQERCHTVECHL